MINVKSLNNNMETEKKVKTLEIDKNHRIVIYNCFKNGDWSYFVYVEERFLWFWYKIDIISGDRILTKIDGFWSLEKALEEAEKYLKNYRSN